MKNIINWLTVVSLVFGLISGLIGGLTPYFKNKKKNREERIKMESERRALLEELPKNIKVINSNVEKVKNTTEVIQTHQSEIQQQLNDVEKQSLRHIIMSAGKPTELDDEDLQVTLEACERYNELHLNHETGVRCQCLQDEKDRRIKESMGITKEEK